MSEVSGSADSLREIARPYLLLEVTRRCNRACVYCYANGSIAGRELSEVRTQEILERLDHQVVPSGITLIGGEPLLNTELAAIAQQISRRRIPVSISTNAMNLDRVRIDELVGAGIAAFEVSYDSPDATSYAHLTGGRLGSIQQTLVALVRSGVTVTVGTMLTRINLGELEQLLHICFALGVRRVSINQVAMLGTARENSGIVLTDGELVTVLDAVNSLAAALHMRIGIGLPLEPCRMHHERFPALEFERCRCGDRKWLIEPSGDVRVCELSPESIGNVFDDSWRSIVTSSKVTRFRSQRTRAACRNCQEWDACHGGCRFRLPCHDSAC